MQSDIPHVESVPIYPPQPEVLKVDVRTRAQALLSSLDLLDRANKSELFIAASHDHKRVMEMSEEQRATLPEQVSASTKAKNRLVKATRSEFLHAYKIGNGPTDLQDPEFQQALGTFFTAYSGRKKTNARNTYRRNLRYLLDNVSPEQLEAETYEPLVVDVSKSESTVETFKAEDKLTTKEKLVALRDDARAGFLPASHSELKWALTFLNYIENPEYPAGIGNQLQEIFIHQAKAGRTAAEKQADLVSVGYEIGDYFTQSSQQAADLEDLATKVMDCPNPHVRVIEDIDAKHPGLNALIRYMDILTYREKGTQRSGANPLNGTANRDLKQELPGKNKTMEDSYTGHKTSKKVEDHKVAVLQSLTIGDIRQLVVDARNNELRRSHFWLDRMYDTYSHGAVWAATKQVLISAGLPINPREMS